MRADKYIAEKFNFSRNKIQQFIDAGLILKNNKPLNKPSEKITDTDIIHLIEDRRVHWVSRSAEKLAFFLDINTMFQTKIRNSKCLDVGASTGGFTQVLLEYGAKSVDSVEVWTQQLEQSLRENSKVNSYEQTDIRNFSSNNSPYSTIVCDASFISLAEILDAILSFADETSQIILLFKPQFEVDSKLLNKNGVPKNTWIIEKSLQDFRILLERKKLKILKEEKSSLLWEAGNQEYIFAIQKN